jgi:hypothetical protein
MWRRRIVMGDGLTRPTVPKGRPSAGRAPARTARSRHGGARWSAHARLPSQLFPPRSPPFAIGSPAATGSAVRLTSPGVAAGFASLARASTCVEGTGRSTCKFRIRSLLLCSSRSTRSPSFVTSEARREDVDTDSSAHRPRSVWIDAASIPTTTAHATTTRVERCGIALCAMILPPARSRGSSGMGSRVAPADRRFGAAPMRRRSAADSRERRAAVEPPGGSAFPHPRRRSCRRGRREAVATLDRPSGMRHVLRGGRSRVADGAPA